MSDKSSDSSCEWILLDEDDESYSLGNPGLQPNLNYDYIHLAASECMNSSLPSEELDGLRDFLDIDSACPECETSCIEDLRPEEFRSDDLNVIEENNVCDSTSSYGSGEDVDIDISSVSKSHCYEHKRNDHLNFILNVTLALVMSSAVGLGTGYFLGWSHKCNNYTSILQPSKFTSSSKMSDEALVKENIKLPASKSEETSEISPSENSSLILSWNLGSESEFVTHSTCNDDLCSKNFSDNVIPDFSVVTNEDSSENESLKIITQNYSSSIDQFHVSNIFTQFESNKVSDISVKTNQLQAHLSNIEDESSNANENVLIKGSSDMYNSVNNDRIDVLKQFYIKDQDSYKGNLTNRLYSDLSTVVQSLNALAISQVFSIDKMSSKSNEDIQLIIEQFSDFQNHIKAKITDIDIFVQDAQNTGYQKQAFSYLQKMVFSLVDSVDYVLKVSIKTFHRDPRRINAYKFSKNISKVIFNCDKKWEKIRRNWLKNVDRIKFQESRKKSFHKTKQWNRKDHSEKDSNRNRKKYKRYTMKS